MATRAVNKIAKEGEQNARLLLSRGALSAMAIFRRAAFPSVRRWRCTAPYPRCSSQPRQNSVFRASDGETLSKYCLRRHFFCGEGGSYLVRGESGRSSMARSSRMRSRATGSGNILARCVPGHQSVASFALHASQKWPRTGKSPVRGKIRAPCIRNELALAGYARHASEKPCKQPFGDTPREDLAMKGPLSLHGPLESCTARRSCRPP